MTSEDFAKTLIKEIHKEIAADKIIMESYNLDRIKNPGWKHFMTLYQESFTEEQKNAVLRHTHQTRINTVAQVLGILCGASGFDNQQVDFELTANGDELDPSYFDFFMEGVEEWEYPQE